MRGDDFLNVMEYIDVDLIEKADVIPSKRKFSWKKTAIAACFILAAGLGTIIAKNIVNHYESKIVVNAEELGQEDYTFGVSLLEICYADEQKIILYDFRGIYVYDIEKEILIGYADFRPVEMTLIQGSNPTFVEVTPDGLYVRAYNEQKKYLYHVETNEFQEVDNYDNISNESYTLLNVTEEMRISEYSPTYKTRDGSFVAVALHESENPRYRDLYLIIQKDGEQKTYDIFQ